MTDPACATALGCPFVNLSTFIRSNLDAIVGEWELFATSLLPVAGTMSRLALRDHCREILLAAVADMQTHETESERVAKSQGNGPVSAGADTAATAHGALRHLSGFDLVQLVAEFRALRASVLALWGRRERDDAAASDVSVRSEVEQITRFNEAIDQALAESVDSYATAVTTSRDIFLAVLGHDLRGPLQAISMTGRLLLKPDLPDSARHEAAMRIQRCSTTMDLLISDLLEFMRTRLGSGIPLERTHCDLGPVCSTALETIRAGNPQQEFDEQVAGDLAICADAPRLHQALLNLLSNAVQHGDRSRPIALVVKANTNGIDISVRNFGRPIPPDVLQVIFEPLVRAPSSEADHPAQSSTSLGLGLFIVREIVAGHGGTVTVESSAYAGTVFTIHLPRGDAAASA